MGLRQPDSLVGRIRLKVAARISDRAAVDRLYALSGKFKTLEIQNGYRQSELEELLKAVDLGIVAPMWDDALPQVAIEFVCQGVPILVSDRGGQTELAADLRFIFDASSTNDFWAKLSAIFNEPSMIGEFWDQERPLRTNAMHVDELMQYYSTS